MKPILFNTEMAKAILDGRKTQTRRVASGTAHLVYKNCLKTPAAKYQIGDILWVREPARVKSFDSVRISDSYEFEVEYLADNRTETLVIPERFADASWLKKGRGIPNGCIKEMARIFLKVTNIRVERLKDITLGDMIKEGVADSEEWIDLWNKTAPKSYGWDNNPFVFVYEFERIENAK